MKAQAGQPAGSPCAGRRYHVAQRTQTGSSPPKLNSCGRGLTGTGVGIPEEVADDAGQSATFGGAGWGYRATTRA